MGQTRDNIPSSAWPPRPLVDEASLPEILRPDDRQALVDPDEKRGVLAICRRGVARFLGDMERDWLGLVEAPLAARMAEAGWAPDSPEVYCDRCGSSVGFGEASEFGCAACRGTRPWWERVVRLGEYAPPLDDWVQAVKFRRCHRLGEEIGELLGDRLRGAGLLERAGGSKGVVVTPVATAFTRRMERKIDHSLAISRGVGKALGCPVRPLLRKGERRSQRAVAFSEREANVRGAFRLRRGCARRLGTGRIVVLVDDVTTSGATLRACARLIRGIEGVEGVWCGVVGVTPDHARGDGGGAASGGV